MSEAPKEKFTMPLATLVILLVFVILVSLGLWQLNRAEQKRQRLEWIASQSSQQAMPLSHIDPQQDIRDLPVLATGTFLSDQYYLLDNRIHQGKVGYQVLGLLQTNQGQLLVNLGWVSTGQSRDILPEITLPTGLQQVSGVIQVPANNPLITETLKADAPWPRLIQQLDIPLLQRWHLGQRLLPYVLLLNEKLDWGYPRAWQAVVMPPEKHLAYAVQWFALAIAAPLIFFAAIRHKNNKKQETP